MSSDRSPQTCATYWAAPRMGLRTRAMARRSGALTRATPYWCGPHAVWGCEDVVREDVR